MNCRRAYAFVVATMTISLPDALKSFVDEQAARRGYGSGSEYVHALIRKDRDRHHLRGLLLDGAASPPASPADATSFEGLRDRIRRQETARPPSRPSRVGRRTRTSRTPSIIT